VSRLKLRDAIVVVVIVAVQESRRTRSSHEMMVFRGSLCGDDFFRCVPSHFYSI